MGIEDEVAAHYSRGGLEQAILAALRNAGKDVDHLVAADLAGADEFHLGWKPATVELAKDMGLAPDMRVLDIGCGLGGPARYFAEAHMCRVDGIDLTADFVACATALTRRCGLADRVRFQQASALALPFESHCFDRATLIHVGMNIADKPGLFAEARRVLKPDGLLCVYDVMRMQPTPLTYPMPWAETEATSFVETPATYRALLAASGFTVVDGQNRRELSLALWKQMREAAARHGPPALSLHVLMGPAMPARVGNAMAALEAGTIAPIEMLARAASAA
jgi:ubiquinone/menaquinone biosynthesis C-methylase UbiE